MARRKLPVKDEPSEPIKTAKPNETIKHVVNQYTKVNLRNLPSKEGSKVLFALPVGTTFVVDKQIGEWLHGYVLGNEKLVGYAFSQYFIEV